MCNLNKVKQHKDLFTVFGTGCLTLSPTTIFREIPSTSVMVEIIRRSKDLWVKGLKKKLHTSADNMMCNLNIVKQAKGFIHCFWTRIPHSFSNKYFLRNSLNLDYT